MSLRGFEALLAVGFSVFWVGLVDFLVIWAFGFWVALLGGFGCLLGFVV